MTGKKRKYKEKVENNETWTENEYDEYMANVYGLEYIAGYTSSGVPYDIPKEREKRTEQIDYQDEEIPF